MGRDLDNLEKYLEQQSLFNHLHCLRRLRSGTATLVKELSSRGRILERLAQAGSWGVMVNAADLQKLEAENAKMKVKIEGAARGCHCSAAFEYRTGGSWRHPACHPAPCIGPVIYPLCPKCQQKDVEIAALKAQLAQKRDEFRPYITSNAQISDDEKGYLEKERHIYGVLRCATCGKNPEQEALYNEGLPPLYSILCCRFVARGYTPGTAVFTWNQQQEKTRKEQDHIDGVEYSQFPEVRP